MKLTLSIPGTDGTPVQLEAPSGVPTGGLFDTGQSVIVTAIELFLLGAVLFSLFTLIRGGVNMMTSGGDKQRFQAGREKIRYAIIGLLVVFFSFALVNILGTLFGINLLEIPFQESVAP